MNTFVRCISTIGLTALFASAGCQAPSAGPVAAAALQPSAQHVQPGPVGIDDDSDFDDPGVVGRTLALPGTVASSVFDAAWTLPKEWYDLAAGDTPHRAVMQLQDKQSADNRRTGINRLLEFNFTRRPPYTRAYETIAQVDADPTVRATALRASNRARDKSASTIFVKALSDKSDLVRLEAAKGLANIPNPNAAEPLTKLATDPEEARDVRIAAVDAMKYYRTPEVARSLSNLLIDRDFSIAWQARRSLVYLTQKNFGYDRSTWLDYFAGLGRPRG